MPRARARRSVSSCSGVALPMSAATGAGRAGDSRTMSRPSGRQGRVDRVVAPSGEDRAGAQPDDARRLERLSGAVDPLGPPVAVGQDQDEPGR